MNQERIQALAKQATIRVNNPLLNSNGEVVCDQWEQGVSLSLFAELLVEECIDVVDVGGEFVSRPKMVERLKQHFGVES